VEQTGLVFEDLVPDETFIHWPGKTIGAEEGRLQALRSLEINPRWHDEAYLRAHPTIEPAIYEPLVIGAVTALTTRTLGRVVANLGWTNITLPRPVRVGEKLAAGPGPRNSGHARIRRIRRNCVFVPAHTAHLSTWSRSLQGCGLLVASLRMRPSSK
jgi:itaconyl-CoA hydratase